MRYDLLERTRPDWTQALELGLATLEANVAPRLQSGAPGREYALTILLGGDYVAVKERMPGTSMPAWCAERHINGNRTFCLGLDKPLVSDEAGAASFWASLRTYLLYQQYADRHGRWPPGRWMSHGDAAYDQVRAEGAAKACGLEDEYSRALEYGEGWLAGSLPRIVRPRNIRSKASAVCPIERAGRRRQVRLRAGCKKCLQFAVLVEAECARRAADREFVETLRLCGYQCCGTMRVCPLKENHADTE